MLLGIVPLLHCGGGFRTNLRAEEEEARPPRRCHRRLHRAKDPAASNSRDQRGRREPGHHAPCRRDQAHGREGPQVGAAQRAPGSPRLPADERQAGARGAAETAGEAESQIWYVQ